VERAEKVIVIASKDDRASSSDGVDEPANVPTTASPG
jgi:hypothetical protein